MERHGKELMGQSLGTEPVSHPSKEMVVPLESNDPQTGFTVLSNSTSAQNGKRAQNVYDLVNSEENLETPDWQLGWETDFPEGESPASFTGPDSLKFWAGSKLEGLLTAQHSRELLHAMRHSASDTGVSDRDKVLHIVLSTLPKNLTMYTRSLMLRRLGGKSTMLLPQSWATWDILECVVNYQSVVRPVLLNFLKETCEENLMPSQWKHAMSTDVRTHVNRDIAVVVTQLVVILRDSESHRRFLACRETDAQKLLDLLQDLLDYDGLNFLAVRPLMFKALLRLSRESGLHPRCFPLPGLHKVGQQVAGGGFGDICKGLVGGQSVSVKIMRLFQDGDVKAVVKEFGREALIWRQLYHPNLLPFFGLYYLDNRLCLVSPWMEHGNILEFVRTEPDGIDRLSLILDVALGLQYLHGKNVVHGDLKALNVLVTPSRRACITDFGLSSIADAITLRFTHSTGRVSGGTARYQAPELFRGESKNDFGSDVYAFACVCYEILTGKVPFYELPNDMAVMFKVVEGKRPSRLASCSGPKALDGLWELLQECWREKRYERPTAVQIVERLVGPLIHATTTQITTDWDDTFSSKFRRSIQVEPLVPSVTQIERLLFGKDRPPANTRKRKRSLNAGDTQPTKVSRTDPQEYDSFLNVPAYNHSQLSTVPMAPPPDPRGTPPSNGGDDSSEEHKRTLSTSSRTISPPPRMDVAQSFQDMTFQLPNGGTEPFPPARPDYPPEKRTQSPPRLLMPDAGSNASPNFVPPTINAPTGGDGGVGAVSSRQHIVPATPVNGGRARSTTDPSPTSLETVHQVPRSPFSENTFRWPSWPPHDRPDSPHTMKTQSLLVPPPPIALEADPRLDVTPASPVNHESEGTRSTPFLTRFQSLENMAVRTLNWGPEPLLLQPQSPPRLIMPDIKRPPNPISLYFGLYPDSRARGWKRFEE